jgi:hypothetical protein
MRHPWLDYDNEYARYLKAAGETPVRREGDFGAEGHIERAAERGAAVVGRVVSQANVEPMLDHGEGGSARDIALDVFFGREDPERELYPIRQYTARKVRGAHVKSKWIQSATKPKTKGALHRQLHVPLGQKIPITKLRAAAKKPGKLGQRARFALNVRKYQ